MNKGLRNILIFIVIFAAAFYFAKMQQNDKRGTIKREQIILGTVVEIQVRNVSEESADKAINEAFNEIRRIDNLFTTYDPGSPVVKINNSTAPVVKDADKEIYSLLLMCDSISKLTDNSFDVSLHEIITAWGFETENPAVPSDSLLEQALNASGWEKVNLKEGMLARLNRVKFNFGAIAKGYAVDRAIEVLKKNGIDEALVNAGGEVKTLGSNWKVGIQNPRNDGMAASLKLENFSVATSGDYEQYFEEDGKRYHHILDPRTGYPGSKCQSVTVAAENNFTADALATGIFIMGADAGIKLIEKLPGTEAFIIDSAGETFMSSGFKNYLLKVN